MTSTLVTLALGLALAQHGTPQPEAESLSACSSERAVVRSRSACARSGASSMSPTKRSKPRSSTACEKGPPMHA